MPPPSIASPASFNDPLPEKVDVVVIGGGVIGVSTAWYLRKSGVSVALCEKGRIAGEQSSRNWGWVRQQGRDPAELPIMIESIRIWDGLSKETGEDHGFRRHGVFYVAETDAELARYERWLDIARQHQLDTRLLSATEVSEMIPGLHGSCKGALYTASDGRAEPFVAVPGLARGAQAKGVAIIEDCAVRTLDVTGGKISGVITEKGRIACSQVVVAGGAWSSAFLGNAGIDIPQLSVKATVARTNPAPEGFSGNAATPSFAFRRREDGGYSIAPAEFHEHFINRDSFRHLTKYLPSLKVNWRNLKLRFSGDPMATPAGRHWTGDQVTPFEHIRVLHPIPDPAVVAMLERELQSHLPDIRDIGLVEAWAGMIDGMPDVVPVIDRAPGKDGLWIATGFSGHGFGIGPGAGRVIADLVQGKAPGYDLKRFRFSRFSDGSPIDLGPTI